MSDAVDEAFLELVITNPAAGGSVDLACYAANIINQVNFQYQSEQLSWDGSVNILKSLALYNEEKIQIRAQYENIDPAIPHGPATTTINGGDTITLQIPLWCLPFTKRNQYIRLWDGQQLIITFNTYSKTDIFTNVVGPSTAAGMQIDAVTLRFKGYNFADGMNQQIMDEFRSGSVMESRVYDLQVIPYPLVGAAIAQGVAQNILLNGLSALSCGVMFFVRSNTITPQNCLTPIAEGVQTVEFLNGSTVLQFYPSQFPAKILRDLIVFQDSDFDQGSIGNSALSGLQVTTYPIASNILHVLNKGTIQGLYQWNNSTQIKFVPGATQANVQLYFVYLRDCNIISSLQDPFVYKQL